MERQKEQEIRDLLEKFGLGSSSIHQDKQGKFYVGSLFQTVTFIEGDFKHNLRNSLKDMIVLCEDYIQKIDED